MTNQYVIAGAGPAGVAAAAALREQDPAGAILLAGAETLPFYSRIRLPEIVDGRIQEAGLIIRNQTWFRDRTIDLLLGTRVESLDAAARGARLSDGRAVEFDACLLATGARPNIPPFAGTDLDGVFGIRTAADAARLRERAQGAKALVAVGGGVLGIEMAAAVRTLGPAVTVVEVFDYLLPRQLDPEGAAVLQAILEGKGLAFRLGAKVAAFEGDGAVERVRLESGEVLPAAAVLVSAGIVPETALARSAGLEVNRGIVVGDDLSTSAAGVFAAGDCAEHRGRVYGVWPAAEAQGKAAGSVMGGGAATYEGTVLGHTLKVSGVDVFSTGETDPEGKHDAEVEKGPQSYRKIVRDAEGRLIGAVLVGDLGDRGKIAAAVQKHEAL